MGNFYTETVLSTGNEMDFLKKIYEYIITNEKIGSGITCSVTKWDNSTSSYITIDNAESSDIEYVLPSYNNTKYINTQYHLDNNISLVFQSYPTSDRVWESAGSDMNRIASNGFNISLYITGIKIFDKTVNSYSWGSSCIQFTNPETQGDRWKNVKPNQNRERKYIFSRYIDDNVLIFWINPYSSTSFKDSGGLSFIKFKDSNSTWHWSGYTGPSPIENSTVYDSNGSNATTKSPMFSFEARTGYLDFIAHSSFVSGSTKMFTSTDIYDCTTVNFGDTLSLKDGANFLAIGAHSMVRLDEED